MISHKELIKKHYILQVKKDYIVKPGRGFYPFEGFGIECGKGWYDILDKLCTKIEIYLDKNPKDKKFFFITQIKEKFGGLRFYTSYVFKEIDKYIEEAEKECYKICEECGQPGKSNKDGWISVLCNKCRERQNKKINRGSKNALDLMSGI